MLNIYMDETRMRAEVDGGRHRDVIGGLWDEVGALQFDFLRAQGMAPQHMLLDVGCGSGRLAVLAVPYLEPGRYFGIDISPALLRAARDELAAAGCADRISATTFHATADFRPSAEMPAAFDFAIAQSVFTHLPLSHFTACLRSLRPRIAPGGLFFATFFTAPAGAEQFLHERGGVTTFAERDPFHFSVEAILAAARSEGWRAEWIGEWTHPRDQQMCSLSPPV